jgi:hypothetical protein
MFDEAPLAAMPGAGDSDVAGDWGHAARQSAGSSPNGTKHSKLGSSLGFGKR